MIIPALSLNWLPARLLNRLSARRRGWLGCSAPRPSRPVSKKLCRISTAATWSTTAPCSRRGRPAAYRSSWAASVVSRSSHRWTGTPAISPNRCANTSTFAACRPRSPDICSGSPTTNAAQPCRRSNRRSERKSSRGFPRTSVSTGCAVNPSASETATPIRRSPTSSPRNRKDAASNRDSGTEAGCSGKDTVLRLTQRALLRLASDSRVAATYLHPVHTLSS